MSAFHFTRVTADGTTEETYRPLGSRVLVRLDPKNTTSAFYTGSSDVTIHLGVERMPRAGEVVAVGPGRHKRHGRDRLDIEVGDRVHFGAYNGLRVDEQLGIRDGCEYWVLEQWRNDSFGEHSQPDVYLKEVRDDG